MLSQPLIYFYSDSNLTIPLNSIKFEGITLSGNKKPLYAYAKNICGHELVNIQITVDDPDVDVIPSTIEHMKPDEVVAVSFYFHPPLDRTEPLRADLKVTCVMVKRA